MRSHGRFESSSLSFLDRCFVVFGRRRWVLFSRSRVLGRVVDREDFTGVRVWNSAEVSKVVGNTDRGQGQSHMGERRDCRLVLFEQRRSIVVNVCPGIARLVRYTILVASAFFRLPQRMRASPSIAINDWSTPIASQAALTPASFLQISSAQSSSSG